MSLETVVEDIREEARERAQQIREEGDQRAEEIIEEAETEAEEIRENAKQAAQRQIEQEREQVTSSAKLEAKKARLTARRNVLSDTREATEDAIADLSGDRRESLTTAVIRDAATEFGDEPVSVYGRETDEQLITEILEREGYDEWSFAGTRDCLGGIVAESDASRVRVNNTFDSILADVWENNLKAISDRLFEDE